MSRFGPSSTALARLDRHDKGNDVDPFIPPTPATTVGLCDLRLAPLRGITPATSLADIAAALDTVRAQMPVDADAFTSETIKAMAWGC